MKDQTGPRHPNRPASDGPARLDFAGAIAHDMKTPLATILASTDLLADEAIAGSERAFLASLIRRQGGRLAAMVDELIECVRLSSGDVRLTLMPVELYSLVEEVCGDFQLLNPDRSFHFETPTETAWVELDREKIHRALDNLLANAANHSPEGSDISISVELNKKGQEVLVRVADQGMGLHASRAAEVAFEPFVSLDPSSAGHGLGLYSVRAVVEAHGGRVWIEERGSAPGSSVCFSLPLSGH